MLTREKIELARIRKAMGARKKAVRKKIRADFV
jgi:hypothetical protein